MNASVPAKTSRSVPARERLLAAADQLFYAEGVQTVGIDRVIEHAGVAKASLYNVFGSKEGLVCAYLASRRDLTARRLAEAIAATDDPRQKILAVFDAQARQLEQPGFNGCAFAAASAEAPRGSRIEQATEEFRRWIRNMFTELAELAGVGDPQHIGRQLHLVYDGAGLAARMDRDPEIATAARSAVQALLEVAVPGPPPNIPEEPGL
jgi:AcrR family transcriptional regulator